MRKLISVSLLSGVMTLIKMIMGFAVSKAVAVYTGPAGMAILGQVQSVILSLNGIINSPVGNGVIKYTSENGPDYHKCSPWWRASLSYVFGLSIITIVLGCFFAENISKALFNQGEYYWLVIVMVFVCPLTAMGTLISSILNGLQNYKQYLLTGMLSAILSGLVMIVTVIHYGVIGALISATIQYALIGFVSIVVNAYQPWLKVRFLVGSVSSEVKKNIAEFIFMTLVSAVALPLGMLIIRSILIRHTGWQSAGEWQAVWKISEAYLSIITMGLAVYYLPKLSTLHDRDAMLSEIRSVAAVVLPVIVIMAVMVYLLRDFAISLLYTEQFRAARDLFKIQLIGDVIKVMSWLYAYPLIAKKATKLFVSTEIIFTATLIFLSYYFILSFGVQGANIAYAVNYLLYFVFVYFAVNKCIKM